jgi:hypothetical protein
MQDNKAIQEPTIAELDKFAHDVKDIEDVKKAALYGFMKGMQLVPLMVAQEKAS